MSVSLNIELTSEAAETVARFVNSTASHVFLTGKAGTGKTTFLKNLARKTHKNFIVVAPTGIAALNAGGVTIHSQFLFPLGMFLPERNIPQDLDGRESFYTSDILARRHPLNSVRKQVLRAIDLLVIDEVSMLRADLLDAIDYRMKAARGNFRQSFGGVQLLLIGDLFQLPPVVARGEENLMSRYYASPWFFESKSLKDSPPAYIELDKIYRQHDEKFISLLNNLRNNIASSEDIETLNAFYKSEEEIRNLKEVITLTTHNYKADELNQRALQALSTPAQTFEASVEGDFPDSMFPVLKSLVLKTGAQIMFVKNDSEEKKYFNGKLATVVNIENDEVEVSMAETHVRYILKRVTWENKKYTLNKERQDLDEEVVGTFEQYPVKLAWAITVHKSQGLTFERAIIDVGQAFADGQVYVALSRLRSLEGLVLRSRINPGVISTDKKIVAYSEGSHKPEALPALMRQEQMNYLRLVLAKTFDFSPISKEIAWFRKNHEEEFIADDMKPVPAQIDESLEAERANTEKFVIQLAGFWNESNLEKLLERAEKGAAYYKAHITKLLKLLLVHIRETQQYKRVKTYLSHLSELDQMLSKKLEEFEKALFLANVIIHQKNDYDFSEHQQKLQAARASLIKEVNASELKNPANVPTRKKKPKKNIEGKSTYDITLELLESGMTPEQIAKERGLVLSTIEGHLAKGVGAGKVSIFKFMSEEEVNEISKAIASFPAKEFSSKDLYEKLNGKYGYGKLRAVMVYQQLQ
jgi:dephospho-CoA kinase